LFFFVGGVTFEEATYVANLNASNPGSRIIIGGNTILNSKMWLREIESGIMGDDGNVRINIENKEDLL